MSIQPNLPRSMWRARSKKEEFEPFVDVCYSPLSLIDTPEFSQRIVNDVGSRSPLQPRRLNSLQDFRATKVEVPQHVRTSTMQYEQLDGQHNIDSLVDENCPSEVLSYEKRIVIEKVEDSLGLTCSTLPGGVVVITNLKSDSQAAVSGLLVGDAITSINAKAICTHQQAVAVVDSVDLGSKVLVTVIGGTRELIVDKRLGRVGITVVNNRNGRGVVVSSLVKGSASERSGLQVGDVVLSINGKLCGTHQEAIAHVDGFMGTKLQFVIMKDESAYRQQDNKTYGTRKESFC